MAAPREKSGHRCDGVRVGIVRCLGEMITCGSVQVDKCLWGVGFRLTEGRIYGFNGRSRNEPTGWKGRGETAHVSN